jgi:hypothetical protein
VNLARWQLVLALLLPAAWGAWLPAAWRSHASRASISSCLRACTAK